MEKQQTKNTVCICVLIFGILLIIASFIVPPLGIIDNSVLTAIGEIFTFTAAFSGFDSIYKTAVMKYSRKCSEKSDEESGD